MDQVRHEPRSEYKALPLSMAASPPVERRARRALWLLPTAVLTGAVIGPLQYLIFYSGSDSSAVKTGIAVSSVIGGAVLGVIVGGLAAAIGYLLARQGRWSIKVTAIGVTLTVAALWAIILYLGAGNGPVDAADLVVPACTALAAGAFILRTQRTRNS